MLFNVLIVEQPQHLWTTLSFLLIEFYKYKDNLTISPSDL